MRLTSSITLNAIAVGLCGIFLSLPAAAVFTEDFDSYTTGSSLCQGPALLSTPGATVIVHFRSRWARVKG